MFAKLRPLGRLTNCFFISKIDRTFPSASMSSGLKNSHFKFTDYDCIGFDLDNTLARYKVSAMIEMEYQVMAKFLVEKKGYSGSYLFQPFDHNFILKGLFVDSDNGNLLRIAPDGYILQASHGTRMMNDEEIQEYYPERHWEPADLFARDPMITWNGPYSEKMRTLLDYFDVGCSLIFARSVDALDEKNAGKLQRYNIWPDLQESLQDMFDREHFKTGAGQYFAEMKKHPDRYYYKCSQNLLDWLGKLRERNIKLFLITGSHVDFATHTANSTLGQNWRDFFDLVVCYAKKPGFFTMKRDFLKVEGFTELEAVADLEIGSVYTHGNFDALHTFFKKRIAKDSPKFLYVGDNLVQDVLTPHIYANCDTVAVCEELEAEGMHGHQQWHPDAQMLVSTVWGSYFHYNQSNTNWYDIMIKHSRLCVPSLEYVAAIPIDHQFECN